MSREIYRYAFNERVPMAEVLNTLQLAIIATEGLFGESRTRLEVRFSADVPRAAVVIDGSAPAGSAVASIFTTFITREFGQDSFSVRRVGATRGQNPPGGSRARATPSMGAAA